MMTTRKCSAAVAALLLASTVPTLAGDRYEGGFTRTGASVTPDPGCPTGTRFTSPHTVFDTLGGAVATFIGCIDLATFRFSGGQVEFVYTDGATSSATCEDWSQVPLHACASAPDHEFRCTFTGGSGRLAGIRGFFEVVYFDYDNQTAACGGAGLPDLIGHVEGHVQLR